jgi:hypothetical protein
MSDFEKSPRLTFIDTINLGRAQLNQLEALVWQHLPNENTTLYKWDMIPEGYNYAACDHNAIYAYKEKPKFISKWLSFEDNQPVEVWRNLPLSVLNRLPGEPSTTLEKRPGVQNG